MLNDAMYRSCPCLPLSPTLKNPSSTIGVRLTKTLVIFLTTNVRNMPLPPEDAKVFGYITSTSLYQFILATNISHNMSMPSDTALPCHQMMSPSTPSPPGNPRTTSLMYPNSRCGYNMDHVPCWWRGPSLFDVQNPMPLVPNATPVQNALQANRPHPISNAGPKGMPSDSSLPKLQRQPKKHDPYPPIMAAAAERGRRGGPRGARYLP